MKMINKEIEKKFAKYPLYSQEGKGDEAVVLFKAFNPYGGAELVRSGGWRRG